VDPSLTDNLQRLAVQGEADCHMIGTVGDIHNIVDDVDTVGVGNGPDTPAVEVVASRSKTITGGSWRWKA
jgi:hypothetical protein